MEDKAEIVTVGDLKKALASIPDDAGILALHPYTWTTKHGKNVPVADAFDIDSVENKDNVAIFTLSQERLRKEALADPENNLTEEDLEKMED